MKKIICLFVLLFVSLIASANNTERDTSEFVASIEYTAIENNVCDYSHVLLEDIEICYTDRFRLLQYTYIDPVTELTMAVYKVYTVITCIPI